MYQKSNTILANFGPSWPKISQNSSWEAKIVQLAMATKTVEKSPKKVVQNEPKSGTKIAPEWVQKWHKNSTGMGPKVAQKIEQTQAQKLHKNGTKMYRKAQKESQNRHTSCSKILSKCTQKVLQK